MTVWAVVLVGWMSAASFAADDAETVVVNQRRFAIPLQVEAGDPDVAEVRLYLSDDAGKTWRLHERVRPATSEFVFNAAEDGEYWFLVRTADAAGRESPDGPAEPELKVNVDLTPPQLSLQAERSPSGDVAVQWKLDDLQADADSLKLQYRTADDPAWRDVEPLRTKRQADQTEAAGTIEFRPSVDASLVVIRAEAADAAGNRTNRETSLALDRIATAPPASTAATTAAPPRDPNRPMLVNSLTFELDYDVDRIPSTAIEKVELWGTRDEGRTWVRLGVDEDHRSPCKVNVEREGNYGFAVVVTAAGGAAGRTPRDGEPPEIRVGVDLTPPKVRLTTAEPDPQGRPAVMKINWQADDEHLGPQAVSLAYSSSPRGPWLPLAIGIPNEGGHLCKFDQQAPDSVYLRIEVRDEAGNLGAQSTQSSIPVEKRQVNVRFVGAENGAPKSAPKWFHVLR
jgi:hypothetical protein